MQGYALYYVLPLHYEVGQRNIVNSVSLAIILYHTSYRHFYLDPLSKKKNKTLRKYSVKNAESGLLADGFLYNN